MNSEPQNIRTFEPLKAEVKSSVSGRLRLSTQPRKLDVVKMFFRVVAVSSPRRGGGFVAHRVSGGYPDAQIDEPRMGRYCCCNGTELPTRKDTSGCDGHLSPLSGLDVSRGMVPTAYAVGYKSSAPFGARKQQRNSEEAATTPKKVSSTPNFWDAVFSIYFFFFPKKQQMLSRRRNNLEGSSLLPSAVRMFECSAVCLFFALAFSTSVSAAATPPGTVSAEDVRKNIQELLKADAAAMSPDPAPVHVQVPKLQEAPHGATTNKKPAPAAKPVAVKPPASTQPAVDPELDKLRHSKLDNPMVAADGFFKAGRRAEAAILYEQGLRNDKAPDKDWALLQLGACQEQADPQAALALYGRLLAECPNSPWRRLATSRQGVLQWLIAQDVPNLLKNPTGGKSK